MKDMNIKAILCDLDGTLIDYYGTYSKETPSLIQKLQEKNILFSLATGNGYFGIVKSIVSELNVSPLLILNGGGMIINWRTGETPWYRPISKHSTKLIVDYFEKKNLAFSLETKEHPYMLRVVETSAYKKAIIKTYSRNAIPAEILKILALASANKMTEREVENHKKNIMEKCKDVEVMKFAFRENYGLDVTSEESTKHTAVLEYANILGISPAAMVAIGDGYNDYPLFTACGYKIAMGNAPKELKEIADIVVDTAANGGMRQALEHIIAIS